MPETGRAFDADRPGDEGLVFPDIPADPRDATVGRGSTTGPLGMTLPFRTRLTIGLIAAAIFPLAVFGAVVFLLGRAVDDATIGRILLLVLVFAAMIAVLLAYLLAADLTAPLRAIASAVERTSAGDLSTPIDVPGDDEIARLAESHNRLASDLERRNRELRRILEALQAQSPRDTPEFIAGRAAVDARTAFGLIDSEIRLVDPATVRQEERIPGESLPVRAVLRVGA
ncbi:MAG TPA: HAMP domain-containing protein, partial [Candidatus Limnocylindrales bacterium]|nr:HAMP domain-containing protein [Candidatus Limnocylindrales bacterium]